MRKAFVTYLGTDTYFPGVLTLKKSLESAGNDSEFIVLTSSSISNKTCTLLKNFDIKSKIIRDIQNPNSLSPNIARFGCCYSKLRAFELTEYQKVVYLDADMLILENIELLFDKPHMSAVIAGGLISQYSHWKDLNAGLLVIEPNKRTFNQMAECLTTLASSDKSDQGFLLSFYKNWREDTQLHLNYKFNVPTDFLDDYCTHHGYQFSFTDEHLATDISVLHFWGPIKPWQVNIRSFFNQATDKRIEALNLWWNFFTQSTQTRMESKFNS